MQNYMIIAMSLMLAARMGQTYVATKLNALRASSAQGRRHPR